MSDSELQIPDFLSVQNFIQFAHEEDDALNSTKPIKPFPFLRKSRSIPTGSYWLLSPPTCLCRPAG